MNLIQFGPGQLAHSLDQDILLMRRMLLLEPRETRRELNDAAASTYEAMKTQVARDPVKAWGMGVLMCNQSWSETLHGIVAPPAAIRTIHQCMVGGAVTGIYAYTGFPPFKVTQL